MWYYAEREKRSEDYSFLAERLQATVTTIRLNQWSFLLQN